MSELKNCPFCNSNGIDLSSIRNRDDMWFVECVECGATFPCFDSKAEAISAWNKREGDKE